MNLTARNKVIALAVVAGILIILLSVVLVVPQFRKMAENRAQIDEADRQSQAAKTLLDQRITVKNAASVTDATLTQLNNAIPENPELPSLIIELQDVAYSSGMSLRGVVPGAPIQNEGEQFITVPVDVETWGTWSDSVDFLQQLRRLSRQVRIVDFEASMLDENAASEANIELPPYYQVKMTSRLEVYVIPQTDAEPTNEAVPPPPPAP